MPRGRLHLHSNVGHVAFIRQMPDRRQQCALVIWRRRRQRHRHHCRGTRLHLVDRHERELDCDQRQRSGSGRRVDRVHRRAESCSVGSIGRDRGRFRKRAVESSRGAVPVHAQPFEGCDRLGRRQTFRGAFDAQRLQLDRDEREQLDRGVIGTEWKFERNRRADRGREQRRIACRSSERRGTELHSRSGRCACAASADTCTHADAGAGTNAKSNSDTNTEPDTDTRARPDADTRAGPDADTSSCAGAGPVTAALRSACRLLGFRNRRQRTMSEPHVHGLGTNSRDRQVDEVQTSLVRRRRERRPARERKRPDRQQRRHSRRRRGKGERR